MSNTLFLKIFVMGDVGEFIESLNKHKGLSKSCYWDGDCNLEYYLDDYAVMDE